MIKAAKIFVLSAATATVLTAADYYQLGVPASIWFFKNIYPPQLYGAVGDGATDDTAAFNSAIAAASGAGGGTVFLTSKTFKITNIKLANNVNLLGSGIQSSIIQSTSELTTTGVIVALGNNSDVSNLTIQGTAPAPNYQGILGQAFDYNSAQTDYALATAHNVHLIGDSDGFFVHAQTASLLRAYNCFVETKFDGTQATNNGVIEVYGSTIIATGPSQVTGSGPTRGACVAQNGIVRIFGGTITASGSTQGNYCFGALNDGGRLEAFGVRVDYSGTAAAVSYKGTGTSNIYLAQIARYDGVALTFGGNSNPTLIDDAAHLGLSNVFTASNEFQKDTTWSGSVTPTAMSGDVNDYSPAGLATASMIILDPGSADRKITGIDSTGFTGKDGHLLIVANSFNTTGNITLSNQDAGSFASNRFRLPGNKSIVLGNNGRILLRYDANKQRWMVVTQASSFVQVLFQNQVAAGIIGSSYSLDPSTGHSWTITSTASTNMTITPTTGGSSDQEVVLIITSDATGGDVITFASPFKPTGTMTLTASKKHTITFISDGVNLVEKSRTTNL